MTLPDDTSHADSGVHLQPTSVTDERRLDEAGRPGVHLQHTSVTDERRLAEAGRPGVYEQHTSVVDERRSAEAGRSGVLFGQTGVKKERQLDGPRTAGPGGGLEALFAPRGIAVIGASSSPGKLGAAMARSLATFPGPVVLVNDRRPDPAAGMYRSVAEAVDATGAPIDLAVLCVPARATATALAEAAAAGARAALVCAGGFAEAGGPGLAFQADVASVVAETGVRLLGPNTSGFLAPGSGLVASFVPGAGTIPAGTVSLVAGSGGILHALAFLLAGAGLGLHLGVGIGNGIDVTAAEVIDHLASAPTAAEALDQLASAPTAAEALDQLASAPSPAEALSHTASSASTSNSPALGRKSTAKARETRGPVGLHVEGVTDGRRLVEAVERFTEIAPVVALVVGRTDVGHLARSHTGALTPAWRTARAALRSAGAVLVDDEREMIDALVALDKGRLPANPDPGVGLVTGQAGPAVLFTDRLKTAGVSVPQLAPATAARLAELLPAITHQGNPVDTGRPGETFTDVLTAVATDPAVDLLATYALLEPGAFDLTAAVSKVKARLDHDRADLDIAAQPDSATRLDTSHNPVGLAAQPDSATRLDTSHSSAGLAAQPDSATRLDTSHNPVGLAAQPDSGTRLDTSHNPVGLRAQADSATQRNNARPSMAEAGWPVIVATGGPPTDAAGARHALATVGIAAYDGVAGAVTGVRALVEDARGRAARAAAGEPVRLVVPERFELPVGEHEGKRLLAWLGIATPPRMACDDRADAHAALARLGGPVVVKMLEPVVLHKARVGGVRLGIRTPAELEAALDALDAAGARRYLVEETAPAGLDLIVGARRDPVFGPMVLMGLGGDLAEDLDTVVLRPAPLSEAGAAAIAAELLGSLPVGAAVGCGSAGAAGNDRVDRLSLLAAITSLGALLAAVPELDEIEINPLRATLDGRLVALDVVVRAIAGPGTVDAAADSPALAAGGH